MPIFNKTISAAVGRGGASLANDVRTIKYLLNTVDADDGGPPVLMLESTLLGELIGHIETFQRKQLGRADGRVDAEGATLNKLRQFDPTPGNPAFVPTTLSGKKRSGKKGGGIPLPPGPKRIDAAVGRNGANGNGDILIVKHLLNNVPPQSGGPAIVILQQTPLNELITHIETFQRRQTGFVDGRVDPEGTTLKRLRTFDPSPLGPAIVPQSRGGFKRG
ncbi:MAG: hypothetical protein ABJB74_07660 [Gemmatimonas sp.]